MDESNSFDLGSNLDLKACDLFRSEHEEDRAIAKRMAKVIGIITDDLKPIMKYLAVPVAITLNPPTETEIQRWYGKDAGAYSKRGSTEYLLPLGLPEGILTDRMHQNCRGELFLGHQDATWMASFECNSPDCIHANGEHYHGRISGESLWADCSFAIVIERLRITLSNALRKREQHLHAIQSRIETLDAIERILRKKGSR